MNGSVGRIGDALRLGSKPAWLLAMIGLFGIVALAALATRLGMLPLVLALVLGGFATIVGFRWPLLLLLLFAALIPLEGVVVIDGFGTISRLVGILFAVAYGAPRLGRLALGAMPPAAWAYLAWAILSLGWAIDPDTALALLPTLLQLFLIAVLVADFVVQKPTIIRPVLWTYSLSAAATAVIGVQVYLAQGLTGTRAVAIQGQDPAQYAAVLVPALVFGLYEVLNGNHRILGGLISLLTTVGIVVSGTRGAWLACVVTVVLFIVPRLTLRGRITALATVLVLLVVAYQVPGVADLVAERTGSALSSGGAGRTDIWSVAATVYQSNPVLGVGYANFPVAYTADVIRASGVGSVEFLVGRAPHDLVVGTVIELGPIGLVLLALFLGPLVLRRGWGPNAAPIQAALASLLTVALFLDVLSNRKQVWLVIGLAAGLAYLARGQSRSVDDPRSDDRQSPARDPSRPTVV